MLALLRPLVRGLRLPSHRARTLLAVGLVLSAGCAGCGAAKGGDTVTTLTYCSPGGVKERLAVYEPVPAPPRPAAAVVYVHGGGWASGSGRLSLFLGLVEKQIVDDGEIFVSVDYRLAPRYPWPAQIEDVKCAVRFLRHDAGSLEIDPSRIAAVGDSAGGQLVSLLGLTGRGTDAFETGPYRNESSAVEAVVDMYGPTDLTTADWVGDPLMQNYARQTFGQPLGQGTPALVAASPVTYVGAGAPPFLIIQGAQDTVVPAGQSTELARRLTAAGDEAELVMVANAGHGLLHAGGAPTTPSLTTLSAQIGRFLSGALGT